MFNLLYFSLFVYYYFLCVYWDSTALTNSSVVDSTSNALLINVFVILIPVFHRLLDVCTNSSCSSKWLVKMNSSAFVDISECTEILKLFLLFTYITVMYFLNTYLPIHLKQIKWTKIQYYLVELSHVLDNSEF